MKNSMIHGLSRKVCLCVCCLVGVCAQGASESSWRVVFNELAVADVTADNAWREVKTREEFDAKRAHLYACMKEAIGDMPAPGPLNARTTKTYQRTGYHIECVLYEVLPGVYGTGNLYIPDGKGPFPVVLVTCGHSFSGKGSSTYQRACVQAVRAGMAAFIYDPLEQGERMQIPKYGCCWGHNSLGVRATLLGSSMAAMRIFDGMRAIDYVISRPEIRRDRIGYMGNSGGGTMTSLMMAFDSRITAAAPSCYITSLRDVCEHIGPQDAEQNIFGQLAFGLNHAGYALLQDIPVSVTCCYEDFFPYYGTRATYGVLASVDKMLGTPARRQLADVPGPHGWKESTRQASVDWMKYWLCDDKSIKIPLDMAPYRLLDVGFSEKNVEIGVTEKECFVTPNGKVTELPGFRNAYDVLRDRLVTLEKARAKLSTDQKAKLMRDVAKVRLPSECAATVRKLGSSTAGVARYAVCYPNGLALPVLVYEPAKREKAPVLMVGPNGMGAWKDRVASCLKDGHPVVTADLTGFGEIGKMRHDFYGLSKNTPEEGLAVMLYLLGDSIIARRATDLLVLSDWMKKTYGTVPELVTEGRVAIPAAHAFATIPGSFARVETVNKPLSWHDVVFNGEKYPFANAVHGALKHYDWTDLLP